MKAQRGNRGILCSFFNLDARYGVGGQRHAPAALPPGMTRYPLYWRLGRPQAGLDGSWKSRLPAGFDPRTVQPVASRYTDWAIAAHYIILIIHKHNPKSSAIVPNNGSRLVQTLGFLRTSLHGFGITRCPVPPNLSPCTPRRYIRDWRHNSSHS
jgi:hypothetical protein